MGTLHPMHIRDCQLRLWNHPKHELELDFNVKIDEKKLQKQIEKIIDTAVTKAVKKINGK